MLCETVLIMTVLFSLPEVILKFRDMIEKLEKDIYAVLRLEKEEKEMVHSEAQVLNPLNSDHDFLNNLPCYFSSCYYNYCYYCY